MLQFRAMSDVKHISAFLFVLLISTHSSSAQMMSASQYREFVKGLDTSAAKWERQFESLKIEQLNVSYSVGKAIEQQKGVALQNLELIRQIIYERQLYKDDLSKDIRLEESLDIVMNMLSSIRNIIPDEQAARWAQALPSLSEIGEFDVSIRDHALAYADYLQLKAEGCSRQASPP